VIDDHEVRFVALARDPGGHVVLVDAHVRDRTVAGSHDRLTEAEVVAERGPCGRTAVAVHAHEVPREVAAAVVPPVLDAEVVARGDEPAALDREAKTLCLPKAQQARLDATPLLIAREQSDLHAVNRQGSGQPLMQMMPSALLLAALLSGAAWQAGITLAAIYVSSLLIGSLVAGMTARIFMKHRQPSLLAMELPAYRVPRWWPILRMTWARGSAYLKRAGVPILIVSAVLWLISNFGYVPGALIAPTPMERSFASELGQKIEPVLRPMGADWRVGVGLISAFAAREVFVSSMAIVFHVDSADEQTQQEGLLKTMRTATFADTGQKIFTPASIIGLIVFFFFSLQCFSTVAVVRKEMDSWKLAGLQLVFYTGLGYTLAVATVQALRAFGVA